MQLKNNRAYAELLLYARKVTRCADEAEDLLQAVLLSAVATRGDNVLCQSNKRWLLGALRKRALFDARSAIRRRRREISVTSYSSSPDREELPMGFVNTLPSKLRVTALLVVTGHTKTEISWLLRTSDAAIRQRIVQIKKRWRAFDGSPITELHALKGELAFGNIRKALLPLMHHHTLVLASHDPDGHLFILTNQPLTATIRSKTSK